MIVDRRVLVAVFAGGFVGALLRAGLVELLPAGGPRWPWATFAANVAGTFTLGCVVAGLQRIDPPRPRLGALLGTGLCGALTTFSALQLELLAMLDAARFALAAGYAGASVAAGLLAVALATMLVGRSGARP